MHKKFEINPTKIKGSCQSGRKVATHNSKSDLPLDFSTNTVDTLPEKTLICKIYDLTRPALVRLARVWFGYPNPVPTLIFWKSAANYFSLRSPIFKRELAFGSRFLRSLFFVCQLCLSPQLSWDLSVMFVTPIILRFVKSLSPQLTCHSSNLWYKRPGKIV